jgi:hypothetical protein
MNTQGSAINPELAVYLHGGLPNLDPKAIDMPATAELTVAAGKLIVGISGELEHAALEPNDVVGKYYGQAYRFAPVTLGQLDDENVTASLFVNTSSMFNQKRDQSGKLVTQRRHIFSFQDAIIGAGATVTVGKHAPLFARASTQYEGSDNLLGLSTERSSSNVVEQNRALFTQAVARAVHAKLLQNLFSERLSHDDTSTFEADLDLT